jgi:hypothetical protein
MLGETSARHAAASMLIVDALPQKWDEGRSRREETPMHRASSINAATARRGSRMLLDGVLVEDRIVRELTANVNRPLAQRLQQALFFSAEIVALTRDEKAEVIAALNQDIKSKDVRERFLTGPR